ncbi:Dienelactone hydrolase [Cyclobacterium xiamenense]|uniref:Dienelactone hydrolase n=1 Tax=Cyclobacterium xiamenense TaxID=1297121 RepID=A0A1H6UEQ6_9BACT|nr:alpha/beta hydrolase family protein [Cyclobacterium xiamenense]SEI90888.1 Dienelactone hydrolase [Cyclobacterium xiamenense]
MLVSRPLVTGIFIGIIGVICSMSPFCRALAQTKSIAMEDFMTETWNKAEQREKLYALLGRLPDRERPIGVELLSTEERDGVIIQKLRLDINGKESVPAYFSKPKNASGKLPVVLFNHSHFGQYEVGKNEFVLGRKEMQSPPFAIALAKEGYAGLCIDSWGFGERSGRAELDIFKEMLWKGEVLFGMMVYDNLRALDYLVSREDIDSNRIATMGMSMGSTMSWWLAALDERIKVTIDLNCLTDFHTLVEQGDLRLHGIYYYVPDLLNHFTTSSINALIAPRPHLGLAGEFDPLTPLEGLEIIDKNLKAVYARDGAPDAWKLKIYPVAHEETPEMRADILQFLREWL